MMTTHPPNLQFPTMSEKGCLTIQMPERLTVLESIQFKETCHHILNQSPLPPQIRLNFSQTQFMDSSGVGVIVHHYKASQEKNIPLIIDEVRPPVMAILEMTGLADILTISPPNFADSFQVTDYPTCHLPETHPSVKSKLKRWFDILGSLVGLGITAILLVPIALAIKLESPGPLFFSQVRCGWLGKRFRIIKFRSMCINAEALKHTVANEAEGAFFKNQQDPRITKVGRFLRRTSLDELPQFLNVLRGEMSLVGTRPPTPDEVERYDVPQWQRLNVKPGMTGEWQVYGRSQVRNFEEVIQLDLRYQENWSLMYDLRLILKTILIIFNKNSGAV